MVLFTPALKALRKGFPHAYITLMIGTNSADEVIRGSGLVNKVIRYKFNGIIEKSRFIKRLRKERFDLSLVSFLDSNYEMALVSYLSAATWRVGYHSQRYSCGKGCGKLYNIKIKLLDITEDRHEVERHLDLIRVLGLPIKDKKIEIWLDKEDREFAEEFLKKYDISNNLLIGMHPGAGGTMGFKCWPKERFAMVADKFGKGYNAKILLVGGHEETKLADQIGKLMTEEPIIAVGKTSIKQTAALIEKCDLFITNDSGPMHIASAVGISVVAIFGPTISQKNAPRGNKNIIIKKDLICSPCYRFKDISCKKRICLESISVEEVIVAAEKLLRQIGRIDVQN